MTQIESLLAENQPWMEVVRTLQAHGHKAYLVGGCVRDLLLGLRTKDADVATSALPAEVESVFPHTIPVGRAFGVIVVLIRAQPVEVATFRKDDVYEDGRHPTAVLFSDETEDARRRDFTINALYLDPVGREILDPVQGKKDLGLRLIRAVGEPNLRFEEDRLRILRAVRFHARLGFRIHPRTKEAISQWASNLDGISPERIRGELSRMLTENDPALAFRTLHSLGPLKSVLPEVDRLSTLPSRFRKGKNSALDDVLASLLWLKPNKEVVAWSLLLGQLALTNPGQSLEEVWSRSAPLASDQLRRFNASKQLADDVGTVLRNLPLCLNASKLDLASRKKMLLGPASQTTLETFRLLALAHRPQWLDIWQDLLHLSYSLQQHPPQLGEWVNGRELALLGYTPGPIMGDILRRVETLLLNEQLHSKEETLQYVRDNFSPSAIDPAKADTQRNKGKKR